MNGKAAVKLVDRKAEKVKAVNRTVNKKFRKQEWDFVPSEYVAFVKALGRVLYIPIALTMAILEGLRAGFVAGLEQALSLMRRGA